MIVQQERRLLRTLTSASPTAHHPDASFQAPSRTAAKHPESFSGFKLNYGS